LHSLSVVVVLALLRALAEEKLILGTDDEKKLPGTFLVIRASAVAFV
jgi:hypothetical protein